jgi:imidazoleglycerol-phosphate dehydratase
VTSAGAARIDLAGGARQIATGVAVLDHLLEELARAGGFGVQPEIAPDDPEAEVGRAGEALGEALAPLLAAERAGRGSGLAPADEALAMVVVEASGRPLVVSNADLTGVGGLGSDLPARFLRALAEELGLTVHVRLIEGAETDHVLRAIFRALGRALARASSSP